MIAASLAAGEEDETQNSSGETARRIPSLDGLRAVAIFIVLISHTFMLLAPTEQPWKLLNWIAFNGRTGVSIFFVISGFIITRLLAEEQRAHGRISLKNFYLRRTLRIFPAYYTFLGITALLAAAGMVEVTRKEMISASLFVMNYFTDRNTWWIGHIWSLSVEEQFYWIWPSVLIFSGLDRALKIAIALVLLNPLLRFASDFVPFVPNHQVPQTLHFNLDYLMCGAAIGLLYGNAKFEVFCRRLFGMKAHWLAAILLFVVSPILLRVIWNQWLYFEGTIEAPSIALLVCYCIMQPNTWIGVILNHRLMIFVGTLSYSLYLWQQPFMPASCGLIWCRFPLNLAAILVCALISYYFIERPFLAARSKYR